jgi:hypothetical protein
MAKIKPVMNAQKFKSAVAALPDDTTKEVKFKAFRSVKDAAKNEHHGGLYIGQTMDSDFTTDKSRYKTDRVYNTGKIRRSTKKPRQWLVLESSGGQLADLKEIGKACLHTNHLHLILLTKEPGQPEPEPTPEELQELAKMLQGPGEGTSSDADSSEGGEHPTLNPRMQRIMDREQEKFQQRQGGPTEGTSTQTTQQPPPRVDPRMQRILQHQDEQFQQRKAKEFKDRMTALSEDLVKAAAAVTLPGPVTTPPSTCASRRCCRPSPPPAITKPASKPSTRSRRSSSGSSTSRPPTSWPPGIAPASSTRTRKRPSPKGPRTSWRRASSRSSPGSANISPQSSRP